MWDLEGLPTEALRGVRASGQGHNVSRETRLGLRGEGQIQLQPGARKPGSWVPRMKASIELYTDSSFLSPSRKAKS